MLAAVGCASGGAEPSGPPGDDFSEDFGGAGGAGQGGEAGAAGVAGSAGNASGGAGTSSGGTSSGGTSSGGKSAAGTSSGGAAGKGGASSGGAAGKGGAGAGGAGKGGGSGCAHTSANCASPDSLGEIAGDAGSDVIIRTGTNGAAFSLLVKEASSSPIPNDLALKASLDVPAGMDYALDVSWIPGGTCPGTPLGPTGTTAWSTKWSDSFGGDDTRLLLFEVKYVSGQLCGDASKWTLTIKGNQ